jgi:hypothetical protein
MSHEARCPQCVFVSHQLGQPTACLLHVSLDPELEPCIAAASAPADYDEPFEFGQLRPTVDRTGPFSLREYVRLQLLRTRIQAEPSPKDAAAPRAHARSLSRR